MGNKEFLDIFKVLIESSAYWIVIETEYTISYIEKLSRSCKDRGSLKWIAETKKEAYLTKSNENAMRSHIDFADGFPRYYFLVESFINEFMMWTTIRNIPIISVYVPKL